MLHNSLHLAHRCGPWWLKKNRDFFRGNREFEFPVTGLCSESLLIILRPCREKRPQIPTTSVAQFLREAFTKSQGWIGDQHGPCFSIRDRAGAVSRVSIRPHVDRILPEGRYGFERRTVRTRLVDAHDESG